MKYLLYQRETNGSEKSSKTNLQIEEIIPTLRLLFRGAISVSEWIWKIISFHRFSLFVVRDEKGDIIHKSARIGRCGKFLFLKKGEYEIGPCFTASEHRGKGIYPAVLSHIMDQRIARYYMLVREDNRSSIRGIEKAGFFPCGRVERSRFGRWKIVDGI